MTSHCVDIDWATGPLAEELDEAQVSTCIRKSLDSLSQPSAEVSVRIVNETEMASLNQQYRGKDVPTNVLSFPDSVEVEEGRVLLGDIVICNTVVRQESEAYGKTFADRYRHMLVHGLLHLLGHDHVEESERLVMEELEVKLLLELGVSNPYEQMDNVAL